MLVIIIAEEPIKVKKLLQLHGISFTETPTEKNLIQGLFDKIADQDQAFNNDLALLIEMTLPDLTKGEQYDNFGESLFKFGGGARTFGGSGGAAGFGGSAGIGGSSSSGFLDGAKTIGTSTASGAAGGGIVGGIIGAVGGIFNYKTTVNQQKMEKDKAADKTFQDLLSFKRGGNNRGNSNTGTYLLVGVTMLVLIGIIIAVAHKQSKKATT